MNPQGTAQDTGARQPPFLTLQTSKYDEAIPDLRKLDLAAKISLSLQRRIDAQLAVTKCPGHISSPGEGNSLANDETNQLATVPK